MNTSFSLAILVSKNVIYSPESVHDSGESSTRSTESLSDSGETFSDSSESLTDSSEFKRDSIGQMEERG